MGQRQENDEGLVIIKTKKKRNWSFVDLLIRCVCVLLREAKTAESAQEDQ